MDQEAPSIQKRGQYHAIYYKFFWTEDDRSISETDSECFFNAKEYVGRILEETEVDSRSISLQSLPGLDVSLDRISDLTPGDAVDGYWQLPETSELFYSIVLDSTDDIDSAANSTRLPQHHFDSGYAELLMSASCSSIDRLKSSALRRSTDARSGISTAFSTSELLRRLNQGDRSRDNRKPTSSGDIQLNMTDIGDTAEDFYLDDGLETFSILSPSFGCSVSKANAGTQSEEREELVFTTSDTDRISHGENENTSQISEPEADDLNGTVLRSRKTPSDIWHRRWTGMKVFTGIVTVISGLGTICAIAYLLIKYTILT